VSDQENINDKCSKTFCVLPWIHSYISLDGDYEVCCSSEEFANEILSEGDEAYNITEGHSLDVVMNSKFMKNVRLQMLDGKWPALCKRCMVDESMGGYSRRKVENEQYKERIATLINETQQDGTVELEIESADYRLGNLCNLKCRMCNPFSTEKWRKDWTKYYTYNNLETYNKSIDKCSWYNTPNLIGDLKEKIGTIKSLHFAGGEPLISPRMGELLQLCIDSGKASEIVLSYNTNLTVLPEAVYSLWHHFKGVKLLCSVDAIGDTNSYIRYPAKWNDIDKNLRFLDENFEKLGLQEIMFCTLVQALNVLEIDEVCKYIATFKNIVGLPVFINLFHPEYLRTQVLSKEDKDFACQKLTVIKEKYSAELPDHYKYLLDNIDQVINFLHDDDLHPTMYQSFLDFNADFDASNGVQR
jgi:wyosine [tRNA(Phe)-imidazoG37] synthetase (radical SAM superfamily)